MLLRPGRAAARRLFSEFPVAARKGKMAALARQAEDEFASKGPLGILGASSVTSVGEERPPMQITEYDAGGFMVSGDVWVPSSVALLNFSAFLWKPRECEEITVESLRLFLLVHPRPEILVIGMGATQPRRLHEVEKAFREEGIAVEQMDTANAVHTFNILNDEKRRVGGALLTMQPRGRDEYRDPFDV